MNRRIYILILIAGLTGLSSCSSNQGNKIVWVKNGINLQHNDAIVEVDLNKLEMPEACQKPLAVMLDGQEIPVQKYGGKLYFLMDFASNETKKVSIQVVDEIRQYRQRAHAELSRKEGGHYEGDHYVGGKFTPVAFDKMPSNHLDHDTYYRYEGPGWESDKVAYRFYLDPRNCIDIFGKKVSDIVLPNVGLDDTEAYLQMADWGGDIFKVSTSLGIGSIAAFYNGVVHKVSITDSILVRIQADGPVLAEIQTNYYGWQVGAEKYDLQSNLSIQGGSRLTKQKLRVSRSLETLATGLVKHDGCKYLVGNLKADSEWNYIALWGKQSLAGDNLGTVLFYQNTNMIKLSEDDLNYLVILKPIDGLLEYYFAAAWEGEPGGIKTEPEFIDYLNRTIMELNNPINVIY